MPQPTSALIRSLLSVFVAMGCLTLSGQPRGLATAVERTVASFWSPKATPGILVGVYYEGEQFIYPFGKSAPEQSAAIAQDGIYEIGSVTKIFTALLALRLSQAGKIDLFAPISTFYPNELRQLDYGDSILTVSDLLAHTSNLPRLPGNLGQVPAEPNDPYANYTFDHLLGFLKGYSPTFAPRTQYQYSHTAYLLLVKILEKSGGKDYPSLLQEEVLLPLGLAHSFLPPASATAPRLALGFNHSGVQTSAWNHQAFAGAMGLRSTMSDLLHLIALQIQESSLKPLLTPRYAKAKEAIGTTWGWHRFFPGGKRFFPVYTHSGFTGGHRCYVLFVAETQTGVVVLTNSVAELEDIGIQVLRTLNNNWKKRAK